MNKPHGLKLINRVLDTKEICNILEEKDNFLSLDVDVDVVREIENISFGVYSPLEGFQSRKHIS